MKYLILLLLITSTLSCDKSSPSPTDCNDNCNYMTCTINGVPWTASCEGDPLFGCDPVKCTVDVKDSYLNIVATNDEINEAFGFSVGGMFWGPPLKMGIIKLKYQGIFGCGMCNENFSSGHFYQDTSIIDANILFVESIDSTKRIITGKFEFDLIEETTFKKLEVKAGKFKLSF